MMGRIRHWWIAAGVAVVALGAAVTELAVGDGFGSAVKAFVAGALAALVAVLAVTLPGVTWRGLLFGAFFIGSGLAAWVFLDEPLAIWALIAVQGAFCLYWGWPYLANLKEGVKLGATWLGVAYWVLGVIGALLVFDVGVTAQRVAYAGIAGLAVAAAVGLVRRTGADITVGIAAAFLLALAAILLAGSGNIFETVHPVPPGKWGEAFEGRFWGGEHLLYHPNALAGLAVMVAIRIGPDRAFAVWQRFAVTALAGFMVYTTNSRAGFVLLGVGGVVHAALLFWRRRHDVEGLPDYGDNKRTLAAIAVPFIALGLVLVASGGVQGFLGKERYGNGGVTSGRVDTWKFVWEEWKDAGVVDKAFGDTKTARAVVERPGSEGLLLPTDSSAVGSLRRGGVLGVLAFLFGLGLVLWRGLRGLIGRRKAPAWFAMAALAAVPTLALNDWLLGGTGGTFWALLLAGEAYLLAKSQLASQETVSV